MSVICDLCKRFVGINKANNVCFAELSLGDGIVTSDDSNNSSDDSQGADVEMAISGSVMTYVCWTIIVLEISSMSSNLWL